MDYTETKEYNGINYFMHTYLRLFVSGHADHIRIQNVCMHVHRHKHTCSHVHTKYLTNLGHEQRDGCYGYRVTMQHQILVQWSQFY